MNSAKLSGQPRGGFILVTLLVSTFFIMLLGVITTQLVLSNLQIAVNEQHRLNAQFSADAAIDHALQELNKDHAWSGTAGEQTLYEDSKVKVTYESTIVDDTDPLVKYIEAVGRTYSPKSDPEANNVRSYEAKLRGITGGNFSVVTGVGGLIMKNSARIVGGNVYVNGELEMSNSAQIGLTSIPVNVRVAHQSCPVPPDTTYPQVCAAGENGEPISMNGPSHIYGEVKATNQTDGSSMSNTGLVDGSPDPVELPVYDREAQKSAVAVEKTGLEGDCNLGQETWAANTKFDGSVTLKNNCTVIVEGNVWITGDLTAQNSAVIEVKDGLTEPPVIMVDGSQGLTTSNSVKLKSNADLVGFKIVTYYSTASCSPDCTDLTGADLENSQGHTTININNNSEGPQTEYYARWTKVEAGNNGNIGALVGQRIELSNALAVTFGTDVSDINEPQAWVLESYKRTF